jgi:DNA helicase IV
MSANPPHPDETLARERDHLARSRAELKRMHDHAAGLQAVGAAAVSEGPNVSTEHLKQVLYRRMKSLQDDPSVPLFFGRLDHDAASSDHSGGPLYVGRRHVSDESGEPMVIDWRADASLPFYRATKTDPMGIALRRRFGFDSGRLTAYEDEHLAAGEELGSSGILQAEIERPRTGPMRDIVATIQPDQDVIVRTDLDRSVCVQGAPGTGKTAVGLHRAAYLLYAHRDQLRRSGVLVVGPNDSFLSYIANVLPALGEIDADQATVEELVAASTGLTAGRTEPAEIAMIKGDARMAAVISRAIWSHCRQPQETLVVPRGARQWRVPAYQASQILQAITDRGVRYAAGRQMLPQRLAHQVLLKMEATGDSPDDRVQNAIARSKPVKDYAAALWPALRPDKLIFRLLTDAEFLAQHADGVLTTEEQAALRPAKPPRSPRSISWTPADLVLIDEATDQLNRIPSLGHVIIDEAQDLSQMQLRAVGRRASTGSVTLLGDLAQATTPWASRSWTTVLDHLGKPDSRIEELVEGFRVPGSVSDFAARLLPEIAPGLAPPRSIRHSAGDLQVIDSTAPEDDLVAAINDRLRWAGSIGVITPEDTVDTTAKTLDAAGIEHGILGQEADPIDVDAFTPRIDVVPASIAKGLEFDHVLLLEPAAIVASEADPATGLRRLYVCLTRAVTSLRVIHMQPLPAELAA